jgi:hypothetical protein
MSKLSEHANAASANVALIDGATGAVLTFDELNRRSIRCARLAHAAAHGQAAEAPAPGPILVTVIRGSDAR